MCNLSKSPRFWGATRQPSCENHRISCIACSTTALPACLWADTGEGRRVKESLEMGPWDCPRMEGTEDLEGFLPSICVLRTHFQRIQSSNQQSASADGKRWGQDSRSYHSYCPTKEALSSPPASYQPIWDLLCRPALEMKTLPLHPHAAVKRQLESDGERDHLEHCWSHGA